MPTMGTPGLRRRRRARSVRRGRVRCTMRRGWGERGRQSIPRHGGVGAGSTTAGWGGMAPPCGRRWQSGPPGPTGRRRAPSGRGVRCTQPAVGDGRTTTTAITIAAAAGGHARVSPTRPAADQQQLPLCRHADRSPPRVWTARSGHRPGGRPLGRRRPGVSAAGGARLGAAVEGERPSVAMRDCTVPTCVTVCSRLYRSWNASTSYVHLGGLRGPSLPLSAVLVMGLARAVQRASAAG